MALLMARLVALWVLRLPALGPPLRARPALAALGPPLGPPSAHAGSSLYQVSVLQVSKAGPPMRLLQVSRVEVLCGLRPSRRGVAAPPRLLLLRLMMLAVSLRAPPQHRHCSTNRDCGCPKHPTHSKRGWPRSRRHCGCTKHCHCHRATPWRDEDDTKRLPP